MPEPIELDLSNLPDEVAVILSDQSRTQDLAYAVAEALDLNGPEADVLHQEMLAAIVGAVEPYTAA